MNTNPSPTQHNRNSTTQQPKQPQSPTLGETEQVTTQGPTEQETKLIPEEHLSTNHTAHSPPTHSVVQTTASSSSSASSIHTRSNLKTTSAEERTPSLRLADCSVSQQATHLLIGNAVLDPVQPDWLFPRGSYQKLTFPRLTLAHLVHWLKNIPRSRHIQSVVVHVGINTCWENTIMESQWRQLLKLLKSVFPSAKLYMSAIVLPRGQHPLWKTAAVSNGALAAVCGMEGAVFVDHAATFRSSSGAPKKSLYKDSLHPSKHGMVRFSQNIRSALSPDDFPKTQSSPTSPHTQIQPFSYTGASRRCILLPTPGQIPDPEVSYLTLNQYVPPHSQHQRINNYTKVPPFHYRPTTVNHNITPVHYNPYQSYCNPTPVQTCPPPVSTKPAANTVRSSCPNIFASASPYRPVQQYKPPSYSDVVRGGPDHLATSRPVCLETYV